MSDLARSGSYIAGCSIIAAAMSFAVATSVSAADEGVATEAGGQQVFSRGKVEEIVVTARKKAESLQDVPMAISAFSMDGMESRGIDSMSDVAAFTPGLTFSSLFGEFLPVPVIRGVAPTAIFGENNVAIFIDGVFVSGREGLNASQLDLERIEVLKGPQSTKYGRNAFAGAINWVTARPGDELEGQARVNVGNYDKRQARVTVSGPIAGDKLSGRIALGIDEWSGSYSNELSNLDIGGYQYKTMQGSLWFTPTDTLDIKWTTYLSDDEIDDSARSTVPMNCEDRQDLELLGIASTPIPDPTNPPSGTRSNPDFSDGPRPQNYCGSIPSLSDNVLAINDQAFGEERELVRSSLHFNWDLGFGTLVALSGFSNTKQKSLSDSNGVPPGTFEPDGSVRLPGSLPFVYAGANGMDTFPAEITTISTGDETTEWSQELRYSSPEDWPVTFDIGAYYYDEKMEAGFTDFTARLAGNTGQRLPADFGGLFPGAGVIGDAIFGPRFENSPDNPVPPGEIPDTFQDDTQSWSVFGGVEFDLGDRWTADFGGRFTHDSKKFGAVLNNIDDDGNDNTPNITLYLDESRRFDYWTWRTGLRFEVTDENMVYASVSSGKKSGGMDLILGDLVNPDGSVVPFADVTDFDIEEITAYELGNKGTLWDERARYDVALFYNDWKDILMPQILDADPETGTPFEQPEGVDLTGGDATTFGVEVSLNLFLTENWSVDLGGSWTKAEYDDADLKSLRLFPSFWNDTDGDGLGDSADISGKELLRQSEWQGNFSLNYSKPISGDWEFYSRSDVLYTGAQWVGAANQAKVPDYTDVNQRLGFQTDRIRLELWIENLFDDDTPRAAFRDVTFNNTHSQLTEYGGFSDMFPFRLTVSHPARRTFGVSARIKF